MKRKKTVTLILFLLLIMALVIPNCDAGGRISYPWETSESSREYPGPDTNIEFTVEPDTLHREGAAFKVKNGSEKEIFFGQDFSLQIKSEGKWLDIRAEAVDYDAGLIFVSPHSSYRFEADWEEGYGALPVGKYRIIKAYNEGSEQAFMLCEFEITH